MSRRLLVIEGHLQHSSPPVHCLLLPPDKYLVDQMLWDAYDDGHVRFKSCLDFHEADSPEQLMRNAILLAMAAVETYADALMEVIVSGKSAEQAMRDHQRKAN